MSQYTTAAIKRWRGVILELVDTGHRNQESRLDHISLWGLMQDLGHDLSLNDLITTCQDLADRGYLKYRQEKNAFTGIVQLFEIQITPKGRDLVEKTTTDAAVRIL